MKSVLFVCTGNTCRSPMAEALLRRRLKELRIEGVAVGSAGLAALPGDPATPEAVEVLGELGLDHSGHRSRPLTPDLLREADLVLTMENRHKQAILQHLPEITDKVYTLKEFAGLAGQGDVEDPLKYLYDARHDPVEGYRRTRDELAGAVEAMLPRLLEFLGLRPQGMEGGE